MFTLKHQHENVALSQVPIIKASKGSQLMHYIQSITSYLAPPIAAVYFLGVVTTRVNEKVRS